MAKGLSKTPSGQGDPGIMLGVLSAVESDAQVTQRKLSRDLGIALGLANLYLKRCVRKGWVKFGQVPMRRYAYYLTPQGFSEKARLTGEYLTWNLEFFRRARRQSTELFLQARMQGLTRFALIGAGELAEVAILSAADAEVEIVGVIDPAQPAGRCAGKPVFTSLERLLAEGNTSLGGIEALMITHTQAPADALGLARDIAATLRLPITPEHILVPRILGLSWPLARADKGSNN